MLAIFHQFWRMGEFFGGGIAFVTTQVWVFLQTKGRKIKGQIKSGIKLRKDNEIIIKKNLYVILKHTGFVL